VLVGVRDFIRRTPWLLPGNLGGRPQGSDQARWILTQARRACGSAAGLPQASAALRTGRRGESVRVVGFFGVAAASAWYRGLIRGGRAH
jgi:hypothetical protein